jgi:tRNA(Ile)-lysidine synthase
MSEHFLNDLEMKVFKSLKHLDSHKLLYALSGGLDSVVGLHILVRLKTRLPLDIRVLHIHHGLSDLPEQCKYRDMAQSFCKKLCESWELDFLTNEKAEAKGLQSEEELRDFRREQFKKLKDPEEKVVTAHHRDDLLETRLIRLIRGTGIEGLLSMQKEEAEYLRPFLDIERADFENYAEEFSLNYLEDPSNSDDDYLRNWLRNEWLPQLEQKREGAIRSMSRSLENIAAYVEKDSWVQTFYGEEGVNRIKLLCLSREKQLQVLASFLYHNGHKNFKKSQLTEILKRLDTDQKSLRFKVMGLDWALEPDRLFISS